MSNTDGKLYYGVDIKAVAGWSQDVVRSWRTKNFAEACVSAIALPVADIKGLGMEKPSGKM
jgi:hypothetical protein